MEIIQIEGLDKSGKHTQSKMLADALAHRGLRVVQSEFHRYDTPTGDLIAKWLRKEYDVDQATIELIMAADKQAQQAWFAELEADGVDVLILDRYTFSQSVYSRANGIDPKWAMHLQRYMREPDYTVLIDIPAEVSMSRKGKHNNGENDRYESDLELLTNIRNISESYLEFDAVRGKAVMVDGLKSVEEVHQDILNAVIEDVLQRY